MSEERKNKVIGKINQIKSNIETFISDVNVNELKSSFNAMVREAQNDFNKLMNKDLDNLKKKLQQEKEDFENKARKFLEGHKKEISILQTKIDKLVKTTAQLKSEKKTSQVRSSGSATSNPAATSKKKVIKKVTKATTKPGFKTKTTTKKPSSK